MTESFAFVFVCFLILFGFGLLVASFVGFVLFSWRHTVVASALVALSVAFPKLLIVYGFASLGWYFLKRSEITDPQTYWRDHD